MPLNLFQQKVSNRGEILGCSRCPLDRQPNTQKVKGLERIKGRKAMLWAMCPGSHENAKGLELVGPAGSLLWRTLKPHGLARSSFDVQNVTRCQPRDANGQNRDPSKRELACCSVYSDEALELNRGRAVIHVVLGEVAGRQLLGDAFQKERPLFWHAPWNAYVLYAWHPSYLLRNEDEERDTWEWQTWRDRFRAIQPTIAHPGRWGYIKSRKYKTVRTLAQLDDMERRLRYESLTEKRRVSFDVEDGVVDGRKAMLMAGFGTGHYETPNNEDSWTAECWSVVLDHPQSGYEPAHAAVMRDRVKRLVEDAGLEKSLANGSYDETACKNLLGAKLRGYMYDTQYGTFLRYSFLRACGLEPLANRFFPEFGDWKDTVAEWDGNFANAPIDRLTLRNCGDCEVTQRLEQRFASEVNPELVKVYIAAGRTLDRMESRGPLLDRKNWSKAMEEVPKMIELLDRQLQQISGDPNFNCGSDQQVAWLIYDVLKLPTPDGGRGTGKDILNLLAAETWNPTLEIIVKDRGLRIIKNTFLLGYERCADMNDEELRSRWALTGAVTGRLRSAGGDNDGRLNMQNTHGHELMQNLMCSDLNWREALEK